MRDNLAGAITATAQAIPAMAAQGQDPSTLIQKIADVIDRRRQGDTIEDAALAVFKPAEQAAPQAQPEMVSPGTQAPVEQAPPSPVAPGQASGETAPQPGQPQNLASILAGL